MEINYIDTSKSVWHITFDMDKSKIHDQETYKLKFIFPEDYPIKPPKVNFIGDIPENKNVHKKTGKISLPLLESKWNAALTVPDIITDVRMMLWEAIYAKIESDVKKKEEEEAKAKREEEERKKQIVNASENSKP